MLERGGSVLDGRKFMCAYAPCQAAYEILWLTTGSSGAANEVSLRHMTPSFRAGDASPSAFLRCDSASGHREQFTTQCLGTARTKRFFEFRLGLAPMNTGRGIALTTGLG